MDTRSRTIINPETVETVRFEPVDPLPYQIGDFYDQTIYHASRMVLREEAEANSKGDRRAWKSFQHFKSVSGQPGSRWEFPLASETRGYFPHHYAGKATDPMTGYTGWHLYSVELPYGDAGQLDEGLSSFYVPGAYGFIPEPQNLDQLKKRAVKSMLPLIKAELSLPNSILELKDFKRPINKFVQFAKSGQYRTWLKKAFASSSGKNSRKMTLRELTRKVAGGYLEVSFSLLPLISDIAAIRRAIQRTRGRINNLINRSCGRQSKHFRFVWQENAGSRDDHAPFGFWSDKLWDQTLQRCMASRDVNELPTVFHAQVEYNYNYTRLQAAHAQLLAHLDALGINLNPAIIWNAIPFSFVVDWVLNIGSYLDSLKMENMRPEINIHRFLWSVTRERVITVTKGVSNPDAYANNGGSRNQLPAVRQTAYRRQVEGLPSIDWIESSGLSSKELSLGAALVLAQKR